MGERGKYMRKAPLPEDMVSFFVALCGALLLAVPAHSFRIDLFGPNRAAWPSPVGRVACAGVYLLALGLLTLAWVRVCRTRAPLWKVLTAGCVVHVAAMAAPPFLSDDTLFYAALGRTVSLGLDPY